MRHNRYSLPQPRRGLIVSLLLALMAGCGQDETRQQQGDPVRPAVIQTVQQASPRELVYSGVVRSANRANLAFPMAGLIVELAVAEGDSVDRGQLLARLDSREFDIAAEAARLELDRAIADYRRGRAIHERSQAISQSDLELLKTTRDLAQNAYDNARRNLADTELRAPFDGIVGRKLVENHAQVQANETVLTLQDLDDLEIVINMPSRMVALRGNEDQAIASFSHLPGKSFPLVVRQVATDPDPRTQTWQVVFVLDPAYTQERAFMVPGMTARITTVPVAGEAHDFPVVVPLTAIVPDNLGGQFVWVVNDDQRAERRAIVPGELTGDRVTVLDGLEPGERIVVTGLSAIRENMRLRPLDTLPTESAGAEAP